MKNEKKDLLKGISNMGPKNSKTYKKDFVSRVGEIK